MLGLRQLAKTCGSGCILLAGLVVSAGAQPTGETTGEESIANEQPTRVVQQVGPTIIFLRDEDGNLQPSPEMTLEELAELTQLRAARADPVEAPQFHFSEATMSGTADSEKVSLDLNYAITVHSERWVRVPMRLGGAVILQTEFVGEGSHFIEYDDEEKDYFVWINSTQPDETHRVKLKILDRVTSIGNERRIELKLPRVVAARVAPLMTLRVAAANAIGSATSGTQVCPIESKQIGKQTEFRITRPGGDFTVTWRTASKEKVRQTPVAFDTTAKTIVKWDSQSRIVWDTTINVQVLQGELTKLAVRLPPWAVLLAQDIPGQRAFMGEAAQPNEKPKDGERALVTLELERPIPKGQSHEVRLLCERIVSPRDNFKAAPVEIGGFDVVGAARQSGFVGVIPANTWQAEITPVAKVFRQYEMPPGFREAGVSGINTFAFLSQAYSLTMSVTARQRKVAATPTYVLRVSEGRLALTAHLRYRVTGAQVDACRTIFPGWEIDSIELLDGDQEEGEEEDEIVFDPPIESTLDIALPRSMRGEFEVRVEASQSMPSDANFFVVNLPSVEADEVNTPQLVTSPASNIQVSFDAVRSVGISTSDATLPPELAEFEPPQQQFLITQESTAMFAADFARRQRLLTVDADATVRLRKSLVSVDQNLRYDVNFGPLTSVELNVPTWLAESPTLQLTLDGQPSATAFTHTTETEDTSRLTIGLPEAKTGEFVLGVHYDVELSPLSPEQVVASPISFAVPANQNVVANSFQVVVQPDEDIDVALDDRAWEVVTPLDGADHRLRLASASIPAGVELLATLVEQRVARSTVVERAWLQTWLTNRQRQDRAVFRIRTNKPAITVRLPVSAVADELMVLLDGKGVAPTIGVNRQFTLKLSNAASADSEQIPFQQHVVEIGWRRNEAVGAWSQIRWDAPTIDGAWTQQVRWQILTPRNRVVLLPPADMAAETNSSPWWWLRSPRMDQRELEAWSGASVQPSPESADQAATQRQFLYASVGQPADATHVDSLSAAVTMLIVCAVALALGAIAIYIPLVRHPSVLLAAGMVLGYAAFRWPTAALFAGQMMVLALAVVLFSQLLQRLVLRRKLRRRRRQDVVSSLGMRPRPSTRMRGESAVISSPSTTANAGSALPLTPSEVK